MNHLLNCEQFHSKLEELIKAQSFKEQGLLSIPAAITHTKRKLGAVPYKTLVRWESDIRRLCTEELEDGTEIFSPEQLELSDMLTTLKIASNAIAFVRVYIRILHALDNEFVASLEDFIDASIYGNIHIEGKYKQDEKFGAEFVGSSVGCYEWLKPIFRPGMFYSGNAEAVESQEPPIITEVEFNSSLKRLMELKLITVTGKGWIYANENKENEDLFFSTVQKIPTGWKPKVGIDWNEGSSITYSQDQLKALDELAMSPYKLHILSGPGGAGKTTLLQSIQNKFPSNSFCYLATTGKAAKVLSESGLSANTISRVAAIINHCPEKSEVYRMEVEEYIGANTVLVVDEVSMLNQTFMLQLITIIQRIRPVKVILTGDRYQLPPIGIGGIFSSLCFYGEKNVLTGISYSELTETHRFKDHPNQVQLKKMQENYRKQKYFWLNTDDGLESNVDRDMVMTEVTDKNAAIVSKTYVPTAQASVLEKIVKNCEKILIIASRNLDCDKISYVYMAGIRGDLNASTILCSMTEANQKDFLRKTLGEYKKQPQIGDLMRITKNVKGISNREKYKISRDVVNGDRATVTSISPKIVTVKIDGYSVEINRDSYLTLCKPAAAMTIHNSQGSTADICCVYLSNTWNTSTSLMYVAATRARKGTIVFFPHSLNDKGILKNKHSISVAPLTSLFLKYKV